MAKRVKKQPSVLDALHETAKGLYDTGCMDEETMKSIMNKENKMKTNQEVWQEFLRIFSEHFRINYPKEISDFLKENKLQVLFADPYFLDPMVESELNKCFKITGNLPFMLKTKE